MLKAEKINEGDKTKYIKTLALIIIFGKATEKYRQ